MKITPFFVFALSLLFMACQQQPKESFTLQIFMDTDEYTTAYLQDRIAGQMVKTDTAILQNKVFTFEGSMDAPELFYIQIEGIRPLFNVFLENSHIKIHIKHENPSEYKIEGSASHSVYERINTVNATYNEQLRMLQQEVLQAEVMDDQKTANALRDLHSKKDKERREKITNKIKNYPASTASVFMAMRQLAHGLNHEELEELLTWFDADLAGTRYYDDLKERVGILKRVAIGQDAIDFSLPNPDGTNISLSEFRGQYVLLNFWASWCPYCRDENPHLVEIYHTYSSSSFEILNVSLDREKQAWIQAIENDQLQWPQVSQLKGWNCEIAGQYAIRSIPQNVLINPDGIIIARNLKGKELEDKLSLLLASEV